MVSTPVFEPSCHLTFDTVESDRLRLLTYLQSPDASHLRLDLSRVTQCDSAGLALLIDAKRLCRLQNMPFEIECMPNVIRDLAAFCGVDAIL